MIEPEKLFQLGGGQKRRKLALTFGALERDIAGIAERGMEYSFRQLSRADYTKKITEILLKDPKLPPEAAAELRVLLAAQPFDELRVCNCARNHLLAMLGTFPAEWDLIIAPHAADGAVRARDFFPGVCVYAEDIRSPFNMGSIFRTAEGLGAERVYISPGCVDPQQPRALRSGMGCVEAMGWERRGIDELPEGLPVFALETGGTPVSEFDFPRRGVCIVGSEELGVSPHALHRAAYGRVSIPMKGLKASLNVGVAFGILLQKWIESLSS
ncbi:MAG: TrmH family RNA methyltransferase [Treponemataceae bacterium]|nr:TrmH family RNA methyltransferase [Treponemataceae bacterium]